MLENFSPGVAINMWQSTYSFFGKNIDSLDLNKIGPQIENHELFPKKQM